MPGALAAKHYRSHHTAPGAVEAHEQQLPRNKCAVRTREQLRSVLGSGPYFGVL